MLLRVSFNSCLLVAVSSAVAAHNFFAFIVKPAFQDEKILFLCPSNKSKLSDFNTEGKKKPFFNENLKWALYTSGSVTVRSIFMDKTVQFRRGLSMLFSIA